MKLKYQVTISFVSAFLVLIIGVEIAHMLVEHYDDTLLILPWAFGMLGGLQITSFFGLFGEYLYDRSQRNCPECVGNPT